MAWIQLSPYPETGTIHLKIWSLLELEFALCTRGIWLTSSCNIYDTQIRFWFLLTTTLDKRFPKNRAPIKKPFNIECDQKHLNSEIRLWPLGAQNRSAFTYSYTFPLDFWVTSNVGQPSNHFRIPEQLSKVGFFVRSQVHFAAPPNLILGV